MPSLVLKSQPFIIQCRYTSYWQNGGWVFHPTAGTLTRRMYYELPSDATNIRAYCYHNTDKSAVPNGIRTLTKTISGVSGIHGTASVQFTFLANPPCAADGKSYYPKVTISNLSIVIMFDSESGGGGRQTYPNGQRKEDDGLGYTVSYNETDNYTNDSAAVRRCITVYGKDDPDWTTNGLGILHPTKCEVYEAAGGSYQLTLEHPIEDDERWKLLEVDRVIRAPVPLRQNPQAYILRTTQDRKIHKICTCNLAQVRTKPSLADSSKIIHQMRNGEQLEQLEALSGADKWWKVLLNDGSVGYVHRKPTYVREQETATTAGGEGYSDTQIPQQIRNQCFRIYNVSVNSIERSVIVNARHVSYDFGVDLIGECDIKDKTLTTALAQMKDALIVKDDRTIMDNLVDAHITADWSWRNPINALLNPSDGVIGKTQCQLYRDNFSLYLLKNEPIDRGYFIRYGKNLQALTWTTNTENVVTRYIPIGQTAAGKPLTLPEMYVDSEHIGEYPFIRCAKLDVPQAKIGGKLTDEETGEEVGDKLTKQDCYAEMRKAARAEYEKGADLPTLQVDIDFTQLESTEEYRDLMGLYQLYLYDTVHVVHKPLGYSVDAQVMEYTYDCIGCKYVSIKLGEIFRHEQGSIGGYQLASGSVTGSRIAASTITGTQLADAAIGTAQIGFGAITTAEIADAAITTAKIKELSADKITSGTVTTDRLVVTGEASIAGLMNQQAAAAVQAGTQDKTNVVAVVANDAVVITDDGIIMQTGGKIEVKAGSTFTVDSSNLDIDEYGTLDCKNARISGDISVNGYGVLTSQNVFIGSEQPVEPVDGMVWIKPSVSANIQYRGQTADTRTNFRGAKLEYTLTGAGKAIGGGEYTYSVAIPYYCGGAPDVQEYLCCELTDGTRTISFPALRLASTVGNRVYSANASSNEWVGSGNTVTLRVWVAHANLQPITSYRYSMSAGAQINAALKAANGASSGWQGCTVQYYVQPAVAMMNEVIE